MSISKIMIKQLQILLIAAISLSSCKQESPELRSSFKNIPITDSLESNQKISGFIKPYKEHLNTTLDSKLSYNPEFLSKNDGDLNTALGNLLAEIVFQQANPVFKKRTGNEIDLVLLNHGGIRANIPAGPVTARTAYQVMPFENEIVVLELSGKSLYEMLDYLEKAKRAHPIRGIKIKASKDYSIKNANIANEEIQEAGTYYIATADYLANGGDGMEFLTRARKRFNMDYKVRNAMIDYFTSVDTLRTGIDDRYIRE